jgi:hypothetical protein
VETEKSNLYEKINKMCFLKREFSDYLSPTKEVLALSIIRDKEMTGQLTKTTSDSMSGEKKGIDVASFMYGSPNFFELKENRGEGFCGVNYVFTIANEVKNAYLYMQRIGQQDVYCRNFAFSDAEKYSNSLDYIFFFRNLFFLSALVFENGTAAEKSGWNAMIKHNEDNIFGFVLAKGRELRNEISESISIYIGSYFTIKNSLKLTSRYDKYFEFAQCLKDIKNIRINNVLNNGKKVGCCYKMSEFSCYGDIFYTAIFERENSFSKNFFPPTVKINANGEIIAENINFARLGAGNLTKKNKDLANQIMLEEIKTIFGETINKRIDSMYELLESEHPEKNGENNIISRNMEAMYFSMKKINTYFNSMLTNICFMK